MLDSVFMEILDMSRTGSVVILVVMLARLLLKKAPKVISYTLWAVVLVRLLCPLHIEAQISVVPDIPPVSETYDLTDAPISVVGAGVAAYQAVGDALNGGLGVQHIPTTQKDAEGNVQYVTTDWWDVWILFGQYVWVAGVAVMAVCSIVSYRKLKRRLAVSMRLSENIYIADDIESPFVIGFVVPKIYLPGTLEAKEQSYIILHEQHHIRRLDHIMKALAFLALMLHWFNPLVWLAFILASRDMEMSCDEAVIRKLGEEVRADYSASLLTLATGKRIIAGTPLAFGEGDPKGRIKNLAKWKKPILWLTAVAVAACAVLAVCLLTDPAGEHADTPDHGVIWYYGTVSDIGLHRPLESEDQESRNYLRVTCNDEKEMLFWAADGYRLPLEINTGDHVMLRASVETETGQQIVQQVQEVERTLYDYLHDAVDGTILTQNRNEKTEDCFPCASFVTLSNEIGGPADQMSNGEDGTYFTVYGIALYQEYSMENGQLKEETGSHIPTVLSFFRTKEGKFVLTQYWQPRDGAYYAEDIREKFPRGVDVDTQKYIDAQQAACEEKALRYFENLHGQKLEENTGLEGIPKEEEETTAPTKATDPTVPDDYEIPDGIAGIITYESKLEEIDVARYTPQQAASDGCVVMIDGDVAANENIWTRYTLASYRGESAKVRLAEYTETGKMKRLYELVHTRNGHIYRLWDGEQVTEKLYQYLFIDGDVDYDGGHYNMFQVYALSNESWRFREGVPYDDSTWNDNAVMVFCNLYQRYDYAPIPDRLQCAEIRNQSGTVAVIWDNHKLEQLMEILSKAEGYMDWPKTIVRGATLLLTGTDGTKVEAMLLANGPMIEIDGVFYNYDPGWKEIYHQEDILTLFGVSEMPENVLANG